MMRAQPDMAPEAPAERRQREGQANSAQGWPEEDRTVPPGWSYNPSAQRERHIMLALALLGFANAVYIALYQYGKVGYLWAPFFGEHSTYLATHSFISRILPVTDGALGVFGYFCEVVFDLAGGPARWRTASWVVLCFVGTMTGAALVGALLTIAQAVFIQAWCTLCLLSAVLSGSIFAIGFGEALATLQYLKRVWVRSRSVSAVWRATWGKGTHVGAGH
jgi:hypothetical protein